MSLLWETADINPLIAGRHEHARRHAHTQTYTPRITDPFTESMPVCLSVNCAVLRFVGWIKYDKIA